MRYIYSFVVTIFWQILKIIGYASPKISTFVKGRKDVLHKINNTISKSDKVLWIHAASLGEYEQGLPILEKLKLDYPKHKILLTFFSPSGYEVKKDSSPADVTTYLPMDTPRKVTSFLDAVNPHLVIFIKYEIWPNYLFQLASKKIPTLLISARFTPNKIYFKSYGGFMRKALNRFTHIYVQDEKSSYLLNTIGINGVSIAGDTRLDRVSEILERNNSLKIMDSFTKGKNCLVAGSTWPEDERLLVDYINKTPKDLKFVIAPHNINEKQLKGLIAAIERKTALFTECTTESVMDCQVLVVDTIGILTKIYSYATLAYVGGGFETGLHNTLEPAVFGIPVIIGPDYHGFLEAEDLVQLGGIIPVKNQEEFEESINRLLDDSEVRQKVGDINSQYILKNKGASIQIMKGVRKLL